MNERHFHYHRVRSNLDLISLHHRLASEGIVALSVTLSRCVCRPELLISCTDCTPH